MDLHRMKPGDKIRSRCRVCHSWFMPGSGIIYTGGNRGACKRCKTQYLVTRHGVITILRSGKR